MKEQISNEWFWFTIGYFEVAADTLSNILRGLSKGDKGYKHRVKIIPVIFNIKHGIELSIKSLQFILNDKSDFGHNISNLMETLNSEIKKIKKLQKDSDWIALQEKIRKSQPFYSLEYCNKDSFSNLIKTFEKNVLKYYHLDVIKKHIKNGFSIEDIENTALKYPENKINIKLDYVGLTGNMNKDDINTLISDLNGIKHSFVNIFILLETLRKSEENNKEKSETKP